jgi:hypothetical protein
MKKSSHVTVMYSKPKLIFLAPVLVKQCVPCHPETRRDLKELHKKKFVNQGEFKPKAQCSLEPCLANLFAVAVCP